MGSFLIGFSIGVVGTSVAAALIIRRNWKKVRRYLDEIDTTKMSGRVLVAKLMSKFSL